MVTRLDRELVRAIDEFVGRKESFANAEFACCIQYFDKRWCEITLSSTVESQVLEPLLSLSATAFATDRVALGIPDCLTKQARDGSVKVAVVLSSFFLLYSRTILQSE